MHQPQASGIPVRDLCAPGSAGVLGSSLGMGAQDAVDLAPAPGRGNTWGAVRRLARAWHEVGRPATAGVCFDSVDRCAPKLTPRAGTGRIKNLLRPECCPVEPSPPPSLARRRTETGRGVAGLETLFARVDGHRQIAAGSSLRLVGCNGSGSRGAKVEILGGIRWIPHSATRQPSIATSSAHSESKVPQRHDFLHGEPPLFGNRNLAGGRGVHHQQDCRGRRQNG